MDADPELVKLPMLDTHEAVVLGSPIGFVALLNFLTRAQALPTALSSRHMWGADPPSSILSESSDSVIQLPIPCDDCSSPTHHLFQAFPFPQLQPWGIVVYSSPLWGHGMDLARHTQVLRKVSNTATL